MMSVLTLYSYAYDFEINGIYYNKIKANEVAVTNSNNLYSGRITIPSTVTYDGINYNVTRIGYQAFIYCTDLTYISIPNSVTSIGELAFFYCTKLSYISIPNSVTSIEARAFFNCNCLTSVGISNNVTNIGWEAFAYCSGLTSITIPNSVTSIGDHAFHGCSNMEYIEVEERNTKYDSRNHCNALIETTTNELIFGCKNTIIPYSVTSIGEDAFGYCRDLTSITISNSVTNIGEGAFHGCSGLFSITIPNSVTNIGECAFLNCSGLTSVTIPNSVTSIEDGAFEGCSGLTSITIPNGVTNIGNFAFEGCSGLISITIPNSIISIGYYAFSNTKWYNIQSDGFLFLDDCLLGYKGDKPTGNIVIIEGTRVIANGGFEYCSGLTSVSIPNSVTSIGECAFHGCTGLKDVYNYALVPQNLENEPFGETPKYKTLHVVKGYKYAYENSLWKETFIILDDLEPTAVKSIKKYRDINIDNWQGLKGEGQINIKNRKKYIR